MRETAAGRHAMIGEANAHRVERPEKPGLPARRGLIAAFKACGELAPGTSNCAS
jgi:hypothetical protein